MSVLHHSLVSGCLPLQLVRVARPTEFDYKHDAKHTSMFVVGQMYHSYSDAEVMNILKQKVVGAKAGR